MKHTCLANNDNVVPPFLLWTATCCEHAHVSGVLQEIGGWGVTDAATSTDGLYETSNMLMGKCSPNAGGTSGDPYWDNP